MDFIITVCDNAEGKSCPVWPGHPITAHWGLPDPAAATGDDAGKRQAFAAAREAIAGRIRLLLALPLDTMDRDEIACALREIGDDTQTTEGGRLDHP
jgi:arsenate reductase